MEYYKDHLKILFIVEIDPPNDLDGFRPIDVSDEELYAQVPSSELISGLRNTLLHHLQNIAERSTTERELLAARRFVRTEFWERLESILCIENVDGLKECRSILDMRGCVLSTDIISDAHVSSTFNSLDRTSAFSKDADLERSIDTLWRFSRLNFASNREFVCCTLFRGSCIYMSSIGSHIAATSQEPVDEETTFFSIMTPRGSRWQVGRLIYRVNEIASLRLMALKNMDEILNAGADMNRIGSLIERLSDVDFEDEQTQIKLGKLREYKIDIDNLGKTNSAELAYKIERAESFCARFYHVIDTMHIGRIEGWQPYTEFIDRRLRPIFEKFSNISRRFDSLLRLYHAQLAELDSEMQRQSTHHLVEMQDELLDASSFQHKIESIALAYYGGSIVAAWVIGTIVWYPEFFGISKEYKEATEKAVKALVFLATASFAFVYYFWQERKHHKKTHERQERLASLINPEKNRTTRSTKREQLHR